MIDVDAPIVQQWTREGHNHHSLRPLDPSRVGRLRKKKKKKKRQHHSHTHDGDFTSSASRCFHRQESTERIPSPASARQPEPNRRRGGLSRPARVQHPGLRCSYQTDCARAGGSSISNTIYILLLLFLYVRGVDLEIDSHIPHRLYRNPSTKFDYSLMDPSFQVWAPSIRITIAQPWFNTASYINIALREIENATGIICWNSSGHDECARRLGFVKWGGWEEEKIRVVIWLATREQ